MGKERESAGEPSSDILGKVEEAVDEATLQLAPGTSESKATASEEAALRRIRMVSRLLDDAFRVPGTNFRIGIDPLVGILPGAGDAVIAAISLYPIVEAYRLGASRGALAKMVALVAIDAVIGSIPVIGSVFDAFWKANKWNLRTVERHVQQSEGREVLIESND